jgi:S1-C subfamily serine protease
MKVAFIDGSTYPASVVGDDPSTDLAVLKVAAPASELHPLAIGDSAAAQVGDGVVAIGSPFGLQGTVTTGIVSAVGRTISSDNSFSISGAIQTDAAINHGNLRRPLLNANGKVIGVNSQIESEGGGSDGVGFAISSDTVTSVVKQLLASGRSSTRSWRLRRAAHDRQRRPGRKRQEWLTGSCAGLKAWRRDQGVRRPEDPQPGGPHRFGQREAAGRQGDDHVHAQRATKTAHVTLASRSS